MHAKCGRYFRQYFAKFLAPLIAGLGLTAAASAQRPTETQAVEVNFSEHVLQFEGRERAYRLFVPTAYDGKSRVPLVIVLHGGGGNAENAERTTRVAARANTDNFLVVYPNGTGPLPRTLLTWNTWNCCGYALKNDVDDVGFVRAVIEGLEKRFAIDSKRIFATGLSNGAMMAYRLACELSDKIAAVAPVAGTMNTDDCRPREPVSIVAFHGTSDLHVRYEGGPNAKRFPGAEPRVDKSVKHGIDFWARHNSCAMQADVQTKGSVQREDYACRHNGSDVVLYTIQGQGHAWPGGVPGVRNGNVDAPSREISATDTMLEFFWRHPKQ